MWPSATAHQRPRATWRDCREGVRSVLIAHGDVATSDGSREAALAEVPLPVSHYTRHVFEFTRQPAVDTVSAASQQCVCGMLPPAELHSRARMTCETYTCWAPNSRRSSAAQYYLRMLTHTENRSYSVLCTAYLAGPRSRNAGGPSVRSGVKAYQRHGQVTHFSVRMEARPAYSIHNCASHLRTKNVPQDPMVPALRQRLEEPNGLDRQEGCCQLSCLI